MNTCTYCAFRSANKGMERSILTDDDLREEVAALQRQGHRRILALTGEHPKYTFDNFLHVSAAARRQRPGMKAEGLGVSGGEGNTGWERWSGGDWGGCVKLRGWLVWKL